MLAAACSSDETPAPAAPGEDTTEIAADATEPAVTTEDSTATASETLVPADEALAAAVAELGSSYRFDSVITTASGDTVAVNGIRVGTTSSYTVEAGDAAVEVVVVDNAVWIRQDGNEEWLASGENPPGDPLAPLTTPTAVTRRAPTDSAVLVATYNGSDIGLDGTPTVEVDIVIDGTQLNFTADTNGTTMSTTLSADPGLDPVTAPATG